MVLSRLSTRTCQWLSSWHVTHSTPRSNLRSPRLLRARLNQLSYAMRVTRVSRRLFRQSACRKPWTAFRVYSTLSPCNCLATTSLSTRALTSTSLETCASLLFPSSILWWRFFSQGQVGHNGVSIRTDSHKNYCTICTLIPRHILTFTLLVALVSRFCINLLDCGSQ